MTGARMKLMLTKYIKSYIKREEVTVTIPVNYTCMLVICNFKEFLTTLILKLALLHANVLYLEQNCWNSFLNAISHFLQFLVIVCCFY